MQLIDYLTPVWVNVLIMLGVTIVAFGFILLGVCLGVYYGLKSGFNETTKKRRKEKYHE